MSGMITVDIDTRPLLRKLQQLQPIFKKDMRTLIKKAAKEFVANAIKISPPGGKQGKFEANPGTVIQKPKDAKERGVSAIKVDLFGGQRGASAHKAGKRPGIFESIGPAILRQKAREQKIGEHSNVNGIEKLWVNKKGEVYGVQADLYRPGASIGEMLGHHKRYWRNGQISTAGAFTKNIGRWRFIDKMFISKGAAREIVKELSKQVGWFAAGWNKAAEKVGLRPPAWIANKSAPGGAWEKESSMGYSITMANQVSYRQAMQVDRIINDTLRYVSKNLDLQAAKIKQKAIEKAGIKR